MPLALWVIFPRRHASRLQVANFNIPRVRRKMTGMRSLLLTLSDKGEKGRLTLSPGPHFHTNHFVIRGIVSRVRYSSSIASSTRAISIRSFLLIFDRDVCDRLRDEVVRLKNPLLLLVGDDVGPKSNSGPWKMREQVRAQYSTFNGNQQLRQFRRHSDGVVRLTSGT